MPSTRSWERNAAFLYISAVTGRASYQPFLLLPKWVSEKSNMVEKQPWSPMKSGRSSSFSLKTSPAVKASHLRKDSSAISFKNSVMPVASLSIF